MSPARTRAAIVAALLLTAVGAPASAGDFALTVEDLAAAVTPPPADELGVPLTATVLAELRGGFILPTGIEIGFGAVARTYSNGSMILETVFTWNPDGSPTHATVASPDLVAMDDLMNGFELLDANGSTIFAHQIDDAGIRNILLNEASARDLRTDTQLRVTLPGFEASQAAFRDSVLGLRLFDDLAAAP